MSEKKFILIGNAFPLSLIRRSVRIEPESFASFQQALAGREVCSFWGHRNTLHVAQRFSGVCLEPQTERPVVELNEDHFPTLLGRVFYECWVLSPQYIEQFRPGIGEEVGAEKISGWQVLRLSWERSGASA